jgi:hypothetical protein
VLCLCLLAPSVDVIRYERVVPLDENGNRVARVSTREVSGLHKLSAVFSVMTHGRMFTLDLELNRGLFAAGFKEIYFTSEGEEVIKTVSVHSLYEHFN